MAATPNRHSIKNHYKISKRVRWAPSSNNRRSYSGKNFPGKTEDFKRQQKGPAQRKSNKSWITIRKKSKLGASATKTHKTVLIGSSILWNSSKIWQKLRALIGNYDSTPSLSTENWKWTVLQPGIPPPSMESDPAAITDSRHRNSNHLK